jgi:transposase
MQDHQVIEQRQVFDIPPLRVHVTEHQLVRSRCTCGAVHDGAWPIGINAPVQYGAQVKALAVHLNQHHLVPLARTSELVQDLFGLDISQASVQSFAQQAAQALLPTVAAIGQAVAHSAIVHADESGIRVQAKLHWLHCAVTQSLTWLGWHTKRGSLAFEALGILGQVRATLVHDGLAGYKDLQCQHSLCNAHHLRELVYVGENEHENVWDNWPQQMIDLLCQANTEVRQHGGPLGAARQAWYASQWDRLLALGELYNPSQTQQGTDRAGRGRHKQSKAFNLLKRLRTYRDDVWRFMTDKDVPFTNNLAEQALRMCKVKQKVSGGFRTSHGADTFFTIRSYLATMRKQGHSLFECLVSTFNGQPMQPRFA